MMRGPRRPRAIAAFAALIALGCGSKEREAAIARLSSPSAKQRAEAVRALGKSSGDEAWAALVKAARDGSPAVRAEAAGAMAAAKRDDAPDAVAPLLRDPDESVRIAAVHALSTRCGERSEAYLRLAFGRSGAAVREQVAAALRKCGVDPLQALRHEETERRRKALELLSSPFAAQRARAAHELGLLGREEDRKSLIALLDDRDGVAAAAAARALGEAGAQEAAPRLRALLGDGGEVSAAAAEALAALGPQAVAPAEAQLLELAKASGDEAVPAAAALAKANCAAAVTAKNPTAAALLASGCPAAPFAHALAAGAKNEDALIESLLRSTGAAPGLDAALSKRVRDGDSDPRIPRLALQYRVAGSALLAALQREQARRGRELQEKERSTAYSDGSAAEIARVPAPGASSKERYAQLMARLRERAFAQATKASAASRLEALLQGEPRSDRRAFIAAALRTVLGLKVRRAGKVAEGFEADPDPWIAAAARGEPDPVTEATAAKAEPDPRKIALWSDDGAVRARACAQADPSLAATRGLLATADPERRVRDACATTNETAPGKQR